MTKVVKKKWAPTPTMKPGTYTAHDVLQFVSTVIAKPTRLNMKNWISMLRGRKCVSRSVSVIPECGTVACLAGWINVVTRNDEGIGGMAARRKLGVFDYLYFSSSSVDHALEQLFVDFASSKAEIRRKLMTLIETHEEELKSKTVVVKKAKGHEK